MCELVGSKSGNPHKEGDPTLYNPTQRPSYPYRGVGDCSSIPFTSVRLKLKILDIAKMDGAMLVTVVKRLWHTSKHCGPFIVRDLR